MMCQAKSFIHRKKPSTQGAWHLPEETVLVASASYTFP